MENKGQNLSEDKVIDSKERLKEITKETTLSDEAKNTIIRVIDTAAQSSDIEMKKRNILKAELSEGNYNPDVFDYYTRNYKQSSVDKWQVDELKSVLYDFKQNYPQIKQDFLQANKRISPRVSETNRSEPKAIESLNETSFSSRTPPQISSEPSEQDANILVKKRVVTETKTTTEYPESEELSRRKTYSEPSSNLKQGPLEEESAIPFRHAETTITHTIEEPTTYAERREINKFTEPESLTPKQLGRPLFNEGDIPIEEKHTKGKEFSRISEETTTGRPIMIQPDMPLSQTIHTMESEAPRLSEATTKVTELYQVYTITEPDTELSTRSIKVKLSHPEKIHAASYTVKTFPFGWSVKRSLNDFAWLRTCLVNTHPGVYAPPIPPTRVLRASKEESLLKDMRFLNYHMDAITHHPTLRKSPLLETFLKETDEMKFELFQKMMSNVKKPDAVENIPTADGVTMCNPSLSEEYSSIVDRYFEPSQNLVKNTKKTSEKTQEQLVSSSNSIKRLAGDTGSLRVMQGLSPENKTEADLYQILEEAMTSWSSYDMKRKNTLEKHLTAFFKYTLHETTPFKDLLKDRENHYKSYVKAERDLNARKDKLWTRGDVRNWELNPNDQSVDITVLQKDKTLAFTKMLHEDTNSVKKLRDMYAYHNYKLKEEAEWFANYKLNRNMREFENYARKEIKTANAQKLSWVTFIEKLNQIG
ncbi:unnamed protein product [Blepharisma stoltei]|uniref:PX domain-containing protein n=1 Tax=Blepharisma stoltei TaxID=1481888 RepID=A0AAU9JQQ2_9CILI|nr:unnamed protein product [Blepharisma stoltei]